MHLQLDPNHTEASRRGPTRSLRPAVPATALVAGCVTRRKLYRRGWGSGWLHELILLHAQGGKEAQGVGCWVGVVRAA
jgi:hypothetical protein